MFVYVRMSILTCYFCHLFLLCVFSWWRVLFELDASSQPRAHTPYAWMESATCSFNCYTLVWLLASILLVLGLCCFLLFVVVVVVVVRFMLICSAFLSLIGSFFWLFLGFVCVSFSLTVTILSGGQLGSCSSMPHAIIIDVLTSILTWQWIKTQEDVTHDLLHHDYNRVLRNWHWTFRYRLAQVFCCWQSRWGCPKHTGMVSVAVQVGYQLLGRTKTAMYRWLADSQGGLEGLKLKLIDMHSTV